MKNQLIIFSKNRACQLDLLISSIEINNEFNLFDKTTIIYKADNEEYKKGYGILKSDWKFINYIEESDFRNDLLNAIDDSYEFTTFMVDDMIMYDKINIDKEEILNTITDDVCCFSLRLGKNCNYSHPANLNYTINDDFLKLSNNMIKFNWKSQQAGDLSYPLSTDGHIYKTELIKFILNSIQFTNPNTLEANIQNGLKIIHHYIVSFKQSKTVSVPVNLVNTTFNNRHGLKYAISAEELNDKYILDNNIIDYYQLDFSNINGPHKEIEYKFTKIND